MQIAEDPDRIKAIFDAPDEPVPLSYIVNDLWPKIGFLPPPNMTESQEELVMPGFELIAEFMLNEQYCGGLKSMFSSLAHFGILAQEDAQCFRVDASPLAGSWVLLAASLVLLLLNHFVGSAASQKARARAG